MKMTQAQQHRMIAITWLDVGTAWLEQGDLDAGRYCRIRANDHERLADSWEQTEAEAEEEEEAGLRE